MENKKIDFEFYSCLTIKTLSLAFSTHAKQNQNSSIYCIFSGSIFKEKKNETKMAFAEKHLTILGILPISERYIASKLQKYQLEISYAHIVFVIFGMTSYFCSVLYFLLFKAKTFAEYSEGKLFCTITPMRVAF